MNWSLHTTTVCSAARHYPAGKLVAQATAAVEARKYTRSRKHLRRELPPGICVVALGDGVDRYYPAYRPPLN